VKQASRRRRLWNLPTRPECAAYAPHDQDEEKLTENIGDDRTPEKTIGEIKYAKKPDKKQGEIT
jgi:hypothetical protein